ncbi:MAG: DUF72 domain-containing protein [Candidatus Pacebacteria bacterium]|nr:DUF72 domain-containing protein [Candidatus Paceibacterota bacterium]
MKKPAQIYIGTSGWHYNHWIGLFYPEEVKGYNELKFFSEHFDTVENNSSFYRISKETTYKTWSRMTPEGFKFSLKLNKAITHIARLERTKEAEEKVIYILESTQILGEKLGAIVIQLPPSFRFDLEKLDTFLIFFTTHARKLQYPPDIAIEFRNKYWFTKELYALLRKHNVALVAAQSSRYPGVQEITADIAYVRMHGPEKLFASKYSTEQLKEWAMFIEKAAKKTKRVYVYFNNDFHGYALDNAKELKDFL